MSAGILAICAIIASIGVAVRMRGRVLADADAFAVAGVLVADSGAALAGPRVPWAMAVAAALAVASLGFWAHRQSRHPKIAQDHDEALRKFELSDRRFREALSRSSITVFAQDTDLRYTWIHNPRVGLGPDALLGKTVHDVAVTPNLLNEADALKRKAIETGQMVNDTVALHTENEGRLYFDMTVTPTFDASGEVDGVLCSAFDVTEMRLFEVRLTAMAAQLAAAYQRFELALENSPITVFEQGPDLRYTYIYNPPPGLRTDDFLDRTDAEIYSERDARRLAAPKERVLADGGRDSMELEIAVAGTPRYYDMTIEAKRDASGAVVGLIGMVLDLTERRRDEKRIRLMLRELTHRSKNLLAVIQAMARKTASLSGDLESFVTDFSLRLHAIAAAHDLLVSQSWHGAALRDLLRASLAPTIDPDSAQVELDGPPMVLTPDAAQNLGLAFHELATNASKYGALSAQSGKLRVTWESFEDGGRICWIESDGPPVESPSRRGFGRILLERLIGATLNGSVDLDFRPDGLVCEIRFPNEGIVREAEAAIAAS